MVQVLPRGVPLAAVPIIRVIAAISMLHGFARQNSSSVAKGTREAAGSCRRSKAFTKADPVMLLPASGTSLLNILYLQPRLLIFSL